MDSLRFLQPLLATWNRLGRSQRLGLGVVLAAGVALLVILSTVAHGPSMAVAFSNLKPEDAAAVVAKLKDAKMPYQVGDNGTISVPPSMVNDAKLLMAGQGLDGQPSQGSGLEMFNQPSFGMTDFAQQVNYQRGMETELARSISRMTPIASARVLLAIPQPTLFTSQQKDPTASVVVQLKPGQKLSSEQVQAISSLVSNSVQGLKSQNLSIVDTNGHVLSSNTDPADLSGSTNKQLSMQRNYETTMEQQLQSLLDRILGTGHAEVRVNARLNWNQVEQTDQIFTPQNGPQPQITQQHTTTQTDQNGVPVGGAPGTNAATGTVPSYQAPGTAGGTSTQRSDTQTSYDVSQSQLKTIHAVGDVQQLNVSVVLDQTTVDPTQIDAIRTALSTAAGVDTQNRGDQIAVTAIPFNNTELVQQQAAANDASQQAQILTYAHLAALVLGPILLLVALRFVIGRGKAKEGPKTASSPRANEAAAAPVAPVAPRPRPVAAQPPVDPERAHVHDQIQQLASSNPGTLASLIQTWIEEDRGN